MPAKKIITGQHISPELYQRSKELRREMTPADARLWVYLRAGRLEGFHFRRQQVIDRFIVDFYCEKARLVVEVDGGVHLEQDAYDRGRDQLLEDFGVTVVRFTNQDIDHNLESVLTTIRQKCRAVELL